MNFPESSDAAAEFGTDILPASRQEAESVIATPAYGQGMGGMGRAASYWTQWAKFGDKGYIATGDSTPRLPPQVYALDWERDEVVYVPQPQQVDDLYEFPDSVGATFLREADSFWNSSARYASFGFKHRRGFLLYGPAGTGKSGLVQMAIRRLLELGGLVFIGGCHPHLLKTALDRLRIVEPQRNVMCVFEDIDAILQQYGEAQLLSLLDGEAHIDRCLNLATTNYPERIDARIVQRPRRFDRRYKIDLLNLESRRFYLARKLTDASDAGLVEELAQATEGMALAGLADLVISIKCLSISVEQALRDLKQITRNVPRGDARGDVGFGGR